MKAIPDGSIDMICADLPYAVSNAKWDKLIPFEPMWEQFLRVCKKNAAIVLFAQSPFDKELALSQKKIFRYELIWEKHHQTGFYNANKMPLRTHENILVFYRVLPTYNPIKTQGHPRKTVKADSRKSIQSDIWNKVVEFKDYDSTERYPRSVLKFKSDKYQNALHHTQKPVKLVETLIKYYSNKGDVILDPTVGSGTTAVAAMNTGRNFIAIEKDEHYFEVAKKRIGDHKIKK
ncbi:MAG: site-specific DNA-methyltransferase [Bacteroidetes bacterium]|nr:MAG: site-specific DNA-methyltransferase [Bacteroidota bacterium]